MPYNTRRKSLSLPSLGIQLPHGSRAHRSNSKPSPPVETAPPLKKVKRSHDDELPSPLSTPRSHTASPKSEESTKPRRVVEHTPPPSPGDVILVRKVDTNGINDDVVIGVIEQLEKTGNRPHLIKDLATILGTNNDSIANSANPAALLSSRLSLYLKRPWTALSPCPLAKELIPVHPRKVFFFLTTQPRMPLPENSDDILTPEMKRLTPSISDPSIEDVDCDDRERGRMSPSPEVELYSPEFEDVMPPTPEAFSNRSSLNPDGRPEVRHRPNRAPSPSLEADERGFTETATAVRARGMSLHEPPVQASVEVTTLPTVSEETPEQRYKKDQELGYALFGSHQASGLNVPHGHPKTAYASSPMMQARHEKAMRINVLELDDVEMSDAQWSMQSPENIDVDELDMLFTGY